MKQHHSDKLSHRHNGRPGNRHPYYRRAGLLRRRPPILPPVKRHVHEPSPLPQKRVGRHFSRHNPASERGFSLVELGIVFLIISLVVIGVYSKANSISDEAKVQRAVDDTLLLLSKATAFRADNGAYTGITIAVLGSRGYSTAPMTDGDGENPWGRDYSLAASSGGDILTFTIDTGNASLCSRLSNTLDGLIYNQQSITCTNNIVTATAR